MLAQRLLTLWFISVCSAGVWADSLPDTIAKVKPGVVGVGTILATRRPPARFVGTGFVVADGKHVVTNAHVVPTTLDSEHHESLVVLVSGPANKGQVRKAHRVAEDKAHDLALLKIEGRPLSALKLGDSGRVREGELYAFSGFPIGMVLGMRPVTHRGIVSAITPIAIPQISTKHLDTQMIQRLRSPYNVFQLDATAYPGNSGSPLYDVENGIVMGVINRVFIKESKETVLEKPSGISYAIPSRYVRALLRKAGIPEK